MWHQHICFDSLFDTFEQSVFAHAQQCSKQISKTACGEVRRRTERNTKTTVAATTVPCGGNTEQTQQQQQQLNQTWRMLLPLPPPFVAVCVVARDDVRAETRRSEA
ncbi:unnamed protein product [Ceratitis capitata]|uniref:(Mediterranean fruit fly) hypothetical protein n=1 Tax=Ceratitis capitata TaxID=7213 RepID=A0A811V098_CERCA|nr:unnamed protein product [Ceratitis capitata]